MDYNVFRVYLPQNRLTVEEMDQITSGLRERGMDYPYCSACGSKIDLEIMRKNSYESVNEAMCLPCYHHNHTDLEQAAIDELVALLEKRGLYHD